MTTKHAKQLLADGKCIANMRTGEALQMMPKPKRRSIAYAIINQYEQYYGKGKWREYND